MSKTEKLLPVDQRKLLLSLRPKSPQRPVDWVWRRMVIFSDNELPGRRNRDIATAQAMFTDNKTRKTARDAYSFLSGLKSDQTIDDLANQYPIIYEVFFISTETTTTKWAIESFILSGLSNKEIAKKLGYEDEFGEELVNAYEFLKFDVRSRVDFDAFINESVLNLTPTGQIPSTEDKLWKLFGWLGYKNKMGTVLLDGYMSLNIMPKNVQEWYSNFINSQVTRKTTSAILTMDPIRNPEVMELIKTNNDNRRLEIELEQKAALTENRELEKAKANLVESISFSLVDLDKIQSSGVELQIGDSQEIKQIEAKIQEQVKAVESKRKSEKSNEDNE